MRIHFIKHMLAGLLIVTLASTYGSVVFAADYSSTNFRTTSPDTNTLGGLATSSSFSSVSSGGQYATGESSSTSFTLDSGTMYFDSFSPASSNWRWYDDETHETPTSSLAGENIAPSSIATGNSIKLRVAVKETAGIGATNVKFALQFSTSSTFTSSVQVVEQGNCTGSSQWCYASGAGADNSVISTAVISTSNSCIAGSGNGCGTHNTSGISTSTFTQAASTTTEYEFTIMSSGTIANTVYFFRLVNVASSSSVPLDTGASYPSLSTEGTNFTLNVGGVASSTTLASVTTNVDASPSGVDFGTVPIGSSLAAAQQLTVTTNAANGYTIFAYQSQPLLGSQGAQISPITGTNVSPVSWSTCSATTTSCYGYHTTEGVLAGGSTRFAADDTYAQFETAPDEIAYSSGPATNKVTNLVYRLLVKGQQPATSYSTNIVYIAVPVF